MSDDRTCTTREQRRAFLRGMNQAFERTLAAAQAGDAEAYERADAEWSDAIERAKACAELELEAGRR